MTKLCIDCQYAVAPVGAKPWWCHRPTGVSPVDGSPLFVNRPCRDERLAYWEGGKPTPIKQCGSDGYYFEQKRTINTNV